MTRCALIDTNPTGELITSGLPVTRDESGAMAQKLDLRTARPNSFCRTLQPLTLTRGCTKERLPVPANDYSCLNATVGSTRMARRVGI
jgi:hypothetical protein